MAVAQHIIRSREVTAQAVGGEAMDVTAAPGGCHASWLVVGLRRRRVERGCSS